MPAAPQLPIDNNPGQLCSSLLPSPYLKLCFRTTEHRYFPHAVLSSAKSPQRLLNTWQCSPLGTCGAIALFFSTITSLLSPTRTHGKRLNLGFLVSCYQNSAACIWALRNSTPTRSTALGHFCSCRNQGEVPSMQAAKHQIMMCWSLWKPGCFQQLFLF